MPWGALSVNPDFRGMGMMQIRVGDSASNIAQVVPVLTAANSLGAMAETKFGNPNELHEFKSGFPERLDKTLPISEDLTVGCTFKELNPFNFALAKGLNPLDTVAARVSVAGSTINSTSGTISSTAEITVDQLGGVVTDTWTVFFTGATAGSIIGEKTGHVHDFAALDTAMAPTNADAGGEEYFNIAADYFTGTWEADDTYTFQTFEKVDAAGAFPADAWTGGIGFGSMSTPAIMRVEAVFTYPDETHTFTIILPRAQASSSIDLPVGNEEVAVPIEFKALSADDSVSGGDAAWNSNPGSGIGPLGRLYFA